MKLSLFTFALITLSFNSIGQTNSDLPKIENDTLYTTSGFKLYENQTIKIGTGSTDDGDFKFIRRNSASMFSYYSTTGYQGLANQANALPRNNSGLQYKVKTVEKRGTKKNGYVYYIKFGAGLINFEVDVENAIASGELWVPEEFRPKPKSQTIEVKSQLSVADELAKLKKLLDEGVITKEEYDQLKKKLLEQ